MVMLLLLVVLVVMVVVVCVRGTRMMAAGVIARRRVQTVVIVVDDVAAAADVMGTVAGTDQTVVAAVRLRLGHIRGRRLVYGRGRGPVGGRRRQRLLRGQLLLLMLRVLMRVVLLVLVLVLRLMVLVVMIVMVIAAAAVVVLVTGSRRLESVQILRQWRQAAHVVVDLIDIIVLVQYGRQIVMGTASAAAHMVSVAVVMTAAVVMRLLVAALLLLVVLLQVPRRIAAEALAQHVPVLQHRYQIHAVQRIRVPILCVLFVLVGEFDVNDLQTVACLGQQTLRLF